MDSQTREKIGILRLRVPVGLSDGLRLLSRTKGDISHAEILFVKELAEKTAEKTGISHADAEIYLVNNELDYQKALKAIYEALYPLSVSILKYHEEDKEGALFKIAQEAVNAQPDIDLLNPEQYCLVVIASWLKYVADEPWEMALSAEVYIVITQIEETLGLKDLADILKLAAPHAAAIINNMNNAGYSSLRDDALLDNYKQKFMKLRPVLIDRLYGYVVERIGRFP